MPSLLHRVIRAVVPADRCRTGLDAAQPFDAATAERMGSPPDFLRGGRGFRRKNPSVCIKTGFTNPLIHHRVTELVLPAYPQLWL